MKNFISFISLVFLLISSTFAVEEHKPLSEEALKKLEPLLRTLNQQQMRLLPLYMEKMGSDRIEQLSESELRNMLTDSLNKFISDSGAIYLRILENPVRDSVKNQLSAEQMLILRRVSSMKVSPDGKFAAYTLTTASIENNNTTKDIFMINLQSEERIPIAAEPGYNEYDPFWSPDSKLLAFHSNRSGNQQIWTININGTDLRQATFAFTGASNGAWSPDGKWISYTSEVKVEKNIFEKYPDLNKINVRVYDKLPVRHWDTWEDESYEHLFITRLDGSETKDLMKGEAVDCPVKPFGGASDICWSPDSKEIAYVAKKVSNYAETTNDDIFVVNILTGETKNITSTMKGAESVPLYSKNGKYLAFRSQEREGFESDKFRLMIMDRTNSKVTDISKTLDQWVGEMIWAPDDNSLYFSAEDGPVVQIYNITLDGKWKTLTSGWNNFDGGLGITPDGKTIIALRRNMLRPFEVYSVPVAGGKARQLSFENDIYYDMIKPAIIKERWFKANDGKKFQAWIIYPPNFDSTKKYPMITFCQGGPQSTISQYFSLRWNLFLMASHGYIVLAPNRRGVPGFGQEWNDAISKDWAGKPMQDILKATDEMAKEAYVDKNGIAAVGASAGGYAAYWLAGNHEKRFKAFVAHCGVFDMVSKYGSTEELWFPNWEYGGPYWDKKYKDFYEENSPHNFVDKWDTPILISTGEKDYRVPFTQSLEAFTAAQVKKIPSKLIIFPNENHWILHPQEQIMWYREFFGFLDTYCKKK